MPFYTDCVELEEFGSKISPGNAGGRRGPAHPTVKALRKGVTRFSELAYELARVTFPQHHWNHLANVVHALAVELLHQPIQGVRSYQTGDQIELVLQGFQAFAEKLNFCLAARPPATDAQILRIPMRLLQNAEAWVVTQIPTVPPGE
jgi:hypothetical protein